MKRRKGVTVFSVFALTFTILALAAFLVMMLVLGPMYVDGGAKTIADAYDFVARNQDILAAFTTFGEDLTPNITVFASLAVFLIVTVIWLVVDLKRGRKIVFFFASIFLLSTYAELIYTLTLNNELLEFIKQTSEAYPDKALLLLIPILVAILPALASLFSVVLFIVDMATGRVEKQETPTFIKEPTEEVEKPVFEEVKDENEVEEEKGAEPVVAPAIEEEKAEEQKEEPAEEEEEKPLPAKRPSAPAKKVKKEPAPKKAAPIKKAEAKKEEKKPDTKKAEPAKKEDARKTQTILLQNEDGQTYAKAFHVSRRPELNKWQVKATGSDKALKLFNTQKEAIEYANQLAKNQNVSVRVHSKEGKIRKHQ